MHWINGESYSAAGYYAWHIGGAITPTLILLGYIGMIATVVSLRNRP